MEGEKDWVCPMSGSQRTSHIQILLVRFMQKHLVIPDKPAKRAQVKR
jgi:hypothetical protein